MDFKSAKVIAEEQKMLMVFSDGDKEIVCDPGEDIPDDLKRKSKWGVRYKRVA